MIMKKRMIWSTRSSYSRTRPSIVVKYTVGIFPLFVKNASLDFKKMTIRNIVNIYMEAIVQAARSAFATPVEFHLTLD